MSRANIPNLTPDITITRSDLTNLLLASIALEEIGIAQIINTEAAKVQFVLGTKPGLKTPLTLEGILKVNESVKDTLGMVIKKEILLGNKLEQVINSLD